MYYIKFTLACFFLLHITSSCQDKDLGQLDDTTEELISTLRQEMVPLDAEPLRWTDEELSFLDPVADKPIIALGESTHGTAEFFNAKRRIFRYLVENHNYKVFAFEADFGESIFINEAVQQGRAVDIPSLMSKKMHFWTWKNREVRNLLEWMSEYNRDKAPEERVHYVGVDCQFNTFHPELLEEFLENTNAPFLDYAKTILDDAETNSENSFANFSKQDFDNFISGLDALEDSLQTYETALVASSSNSEFALHKRLLRLIRQVSEVRYFNSINDYSTNYRDKYMAENTRWMLEYYQGEKVVLWAHNAHVAYDPEYGSGSIGHYMMQEAPDIYTNLAFMFSKGTFVAVGRIDGQNQGLNVYEIEEEPIENSVNGIFNKTGTAAFAVNVEDLQKHQPWRDFFNKELNYLSLGAVFLGEAKNHYRYFRPSLYDHIIYVDQTRAAVPLRTR
jgi:erythromycin esterase